MTYKMTSVMTISCIMTIDYHDNLYDGLHRNIYTCLGKAWLIIYPVYRMHGFAGVGGVVLKIKIKN